MMADGLPPPQPLGLYNSPGKENRAGRSGRTPPGASAPFGEASLLPDASSSASLPPSEKLCCPLSSLTGVLFPLAGAMVSRADSGGGAGGSRGREAHHELRPGEGGARLGPALDATV